jgi:hypothetical protein
MRSVVSGLVVVGLLAGGPSFAQQRATAPAPPASLMAAAREALTAGRAANAVAIAEAVLQQSASHRDATDVRICGLVSLGNVRAAHEAYDRFVTLSRVEDLALLRPIALGHLRAMAADGAVEWRLRVAALERLAKSGDAGADRDLQRLSAEGAGTGLGVMADAALAKVGDKAAVRRLADAASSDRLRDKSLVADALRAVGARDQAHVLVPLLADENPMTRIAALEALADLGYKPAIPEIRALLDDDYRGMPGRAALALKRLGDSSADDRLGDLSKSPAPDMWLVAIDLSPAMKPADRDAIIKQVLANADPRMRVRAAEVLARTDPAAARGILGKIAEEGDVSARTEAARGLEPLAAAGDAGVLHKLVGEPNPWLRLYGAGGVVAATRRN